MDRSDVLYAVVRLTLLEAHGAARTFVAILLLCVSLLAALTFVVTGVPARCVPTPRLRTRWTSRPPVATPVLAGSHDPPPPD